MVMRSIASRMALWVLTGSTLVFSLIGAAVLTLTRAQILEQSHHAASALAAGAGGQIRIDRVAVATQTLASLIESHPEDAERLLRDTLKSNEDLAGLAAVFRPQKPVPGASPASSPFVGRLKDGALTSRDLLKDPTSYAEKPWFLGGLSCTTGCWQRAFFSLSRQRQLINYSVAMRRNGHPIGIINADVTLDWLHRILAQLDKPAGSYAFVLDNEGHYLAHDNPSLLGKRATDGLLEILASDEPVSVRLPVAQNPSASGPVWVYSTPVHGTNWRMGLVVPETRIYAGVRRIFTASLGFAVLALFGLAAITLVTIRRSMAPLGVLADRAEHVARGELDFEIPPSRRPDEVGRLTQSFDKMRQELALHMEDLARTAREKQRLASELDIAHQIQMGLLPGEHYVDVRGIRFELHAALRPARAVGGDLYCYFMLDTHRLYLMVGDVSDKGIPAALFMAQTITLAKALAPQAQSPERLLQKLNIELCRGNDSCMFVTLLCGLLDTRDGSMVLASAGHEAPALCDGGTARLIEFETGPVLGLHDDATYPLHALNLRPCHTLFMYTDGITEASNERQQMYGIERAIGCLARTPREVPPAGYIHQLLEDVDLFVGGAPQADDITVLALTRHGATEASRQIRTPAALRDVFDALGRCDEILRDAGVVDSRREDIRLVLEELMVNTVSYGYPSGQQGEIRLQLHIDTEGVGIELDDDGIAFDPCQAASPTLTGDIADREELGGLGVHLVRSLSSDVRYRHDTRGNHLELRFNHPHEEGSSS